jgi:hypothetical protein
MLSKHPAKNSATNNSQTKVRRATIGHLLTKVDILIHSAPILPPPSIAGNFRAIPLQLTRFGTIQAFSVRVLKRSERTLRRMDYQNSRAGA